jgi:hypothetical protein
MRIAIMQPTYLPWMGYFALVDQVDTFVLLDDVEFNERSWQQRNKIKATDGPMWLTVPVLKSGRRGQTIQEVEINTDERWQDKHRKSIEFNYAGAEYVSDLEDWLHQTYDEAEWERLCALNVHVITTLTDRLGLEVDFVRSSEVDASGQKANRLVDLCQALGASEYLSPLGSREYIREDNPFPSTDVDLLYQHFEHPTYEQQHGDFVSHMSVVDLMLNEGDESRAILRSGEREPYTAEEAHRMAENSGA